MKEIRDVKLIDWSEAHSKCRREQHAVDVKGGTRFFVACMVHKEIFCYDFLLTPADRIL